MPCPHRNVQQFTECCLDCGVNIYETDADRVKRLRAEIASLTRTKLQLLGDELEAERDRLRDELRKKEDPDQGQGGW